MSDNYDKQYPFDFSVVMAVYNVKDYLREAVESLVAQDFGFNRIQLVLVDDGSTDDSGKICDEYGQRFPENITVIHKENDGVASARNEGLKYAYGRFLNFMDSDDKMSDDTFRKVYNFFCAHEAETDIVTIPIKFFEAENKPHWQNWKFEQGSRVIDLNIEYQTTDMSSSASFFAASAKERICFDSRLVVSEDTKVILTVLAEKMTLGVVSDCWYYYRRRKTGPLSLVKSASLKKDWYSGYLTNLVEWEQGYYRKRFGTVPLFVQYELMCDLQWRILDQKDMKKVLNEQEQEAYKTQLLAAVCSFDDCIILEQRVLEDYHKWWLLEKKHGKSATLGRKQLDSSSSIYKDKDEQKWAFLSDQLLTLEFLRLGHGKLTVEGLLHLYGIDDLPISLSLSAGEEKVPCVLNHRELDDHFSFGECICQGYSFRGELAYEKIKGKTSIDFLMCVGGKDIPKTNIQYGEFAPLSTYLSSYYCRDGYIVQPTSSGLVVKQNKPGQWLLHEFAFLKELWTTNQEGTRKAVVVRMLVRLMKLFYRKPLWLLSDRVMKAGDNGEALFHWLTEHHAKELSCCFIIDEKSPDYARVSTYGKVVPMLSMKHKLLYLLSTYNISSHADPANDAPFWGHDEGYRDILSEKKNIFLQHGVTKDDLSGWLARSRKNLHGFITVGLPEYNSILQGQYGYSEKEVWLTGFPRFDLLQEGNGERKQITIAPTWRAYLTPDIDLASSERQITQALLESRFLAFYNSLLNHPRLLQAADETGYRIAFLPHPTLQNHPELFHQNSQVLFLGRECSYQDVYTQSSLIVTDYSSVVFDFVLLDKPVVYCQFDRDEFFGGEHVYQKGYFDYIHDGFGEVEYDLESTVDRIIEYMNTGCIMKDKYRARVDRFFAYRDRNNCQRVYEHILQAENEVL